MPRGYYERKPRAEKVKEPEVPRTVVKTGGLVSDLEGQLAKLQKKGKTPTAIELDGSAAEAIRLDPWFGDDGVTRTWKGIPLKTVAGRSRREIIG